MNELEWLANHMGHTLSVHRKYSGFTRPDPELTPYKPKVNPERTLNKGRTLKADATC